jgi:DNA-binding transcriptional MerR regulator
MSDETLLTLRQLAEQLQLPESTVRYYRDAFLDQIPSVGTGRRRRYPPQAAEVLRSIAKSYAAGRSRSEIVTNIHARGPRPAVAVPAAQASTSRPVDEVSNLDLLAAIVDGEREQRDALWQMAKEIVRLTEVLEGQDKVLNEIASQAGVTVSALGTGAKPQLAAGTPSGSPTPETVPSGSEAPPAPTPAPARGPVPVEVPPAAAPVGEPVTATWMSGPVPEDDVTPPPSPATPPWSAGHHDMDRLRQELEAERELVERLREAKLQLEHRAADAEAELAERRRSSVIRRIFGGDDAK